MTIPPPQAIQQLLQQDNFESQSGFAYAKHNWSSWFGHLDGMTGFIDSLPDAFDRPTVSRVVEDQLADHPERAFVTAMMWGHGTSGYGPYRTAYILTRSRSKGGGDLSSASTAHLTEAALLTRQSGPAAGYRYLNNYNAGKIPGLGPAFFTKWLFFTTTDNGRNTAGTAPILDQLVISWLRSVANLQIRPGRTPEYERYVETLRAWGEPFQLTPADVEERIFRLIRESQSR